MDDDAVFIAIERLAKIDDANAASFRRALRSIVNEHSPRLPDDKRVKAPSLFRADIVDPLKPIATSARELKRRLVGIDDYFADTPPWAVFLQAKLVKTGVDGAALMAALEVLGQADEAALEYKTPQVSENAARLLLVKRLLAATAEHGGKLPFHNEGGLAVGALVDAIRLLQPLLDGALLPADFIPQRGFMRLLEAARREINRSVETD